MNKKLQKVLEEIEKTETKITQWQDHLKLLLIQKKQLEDTEILKSIDTQIDYLIAKEQLKKRI